MEINMRGNYLMEKKMGKEFIIIIIMIDMKDNLLMIKKVDLDIIIFKKVIIIKVIGVMIY